VLANLKIAVKLGAGFGLVLVLTLGVGLTGWNGLREAEQRTKKLTGVEAVARHAFWAHLPQNDFTITHDATYVAHVKEEVAKLLARACRGDPQACPTEYIHLL
jgi:hypothetical protein